jgi:glucans biosynthesis protein
MHAALTRVRSHSAAAARLVRLAYFLQRHTVRVCLGGALASAAQAVSAIGFEDVAARAQALAQSPHKPVASTVPPQLKALSYDQYRDIRFKPERALWRGEPRPFEAMFFHLGPLQSEPVLVNEITPQGVRHLPFDRSAFDYGRNLVSPQTWGDVGFAGFRLHYPLNRGDYKDEVIVFLGGTYFRALGAGQRYGLSARGLAIDTAGGVREEFPRFREFWIERPAAGADSITMYALADSPRSSSAFRFVVRPGADTVVQVRARIYLREPVATFGVAALTSMFLSGENQPRRGDFRPEVHDSDGLMVQTGEGEWIWRPLTNPGAPLPTSFSTRSPRGFGLMQRDRAFASYEDTEARYELRPSAWVVPRGDWGPGRVELVQLPTPDEANDNVVAYWVPQRQPTLSEPLDIAYDIHWQGALQQRPPNAWVVQTRVGRGFDEIGEDERQYVVDFEGPALAGLAGDASIKAVVSAGANGRLIATNAYPNEATGGWRMTLRVQQVDARQPVELRGFLQHGNDILSETWSSIIPPR